MADKYTSNPLYASLTPIPLQDGSEAHPPLASISYSPAYTAATSYLRALMQANEYSERALTLTRDIILMNPAHYTVWGYRAKCLFEIQDGKKEQRLREEVLWLNEVAERNLKNYQIWHHRQVIMTHLPASFATSSEPPFLRTMFIHDSKNYHVWTYRQWFVRHFNLFDSPSELSSTEALITSDPRNNSAWNHRWFLCFGKEELERGKFGEKGVEVLKVVDEDLIEREMGFVIRMIEDAPQNGASWNYMRGLCKRSARPLKEMREIAMRYVGSEAGDATVPVEEVKGVKSSFAMEWVADCAVEDGEGEVARRMLELLRDRFDPIRKNYWEWRIGGLGIEEEGEDGKMQQQGTLVGASA